MNNPDAKKIWAEIVAKAWKDEKFKEKLLSNPEEVFKKYGYILPKHTSIQVLEDTDNKHYLILPQKLKETPSEEDLKRISAGGQVFDCYKA
jgi:hypothetical protein